MAQQVTQQVGEQLLFNIGYNDLSQNDGSDIDADLVDEVNAKLSLIPEITNTQHNTQLQGFRPISSGGQFSRDSNQSFRLTNQSLLENDT